MFHYLEKFGAELAPEQPTIPFLYEEFRKLVTEDLRCSSRVTSNGLESLGVAMVEYMF